MKMTVDENKSICCTISKETKFYLEHIIIYFERTFLVIIVIKYLIKEGSHSKQAWVDILSLLYAIRLKHHEMRKHDNAMLGHPDMFWFDTRGVTHGDTWGHLKQWNSVMPGRWLGWDTQTYVTMKLQIQTSIWYISHYNQKTWKCTSLAIQC